MNDWRKIRLRDVSRLCFDVPKRLRWRWVNSTEQGQTRIQMISPRGVAWDLRLERGAWIKRA